MTLKKQPPNNKKQTKGRVYFKKEWHTNFWPNPANGLCKTFCIEWFAGQSPFKLKNVESDRGAHHLFDLSYFILLKYVGEWDQFLMCDFIPYALIRILNSELWNKLMPADNRFSLFFKKKKTNNFSALLIHIVFTGNWVQLCTHTFPVPIKPASLIHDRFYQSARETEEREARRGKTLLDKHTEDVPI